MTLDGKVATRTGDSKWISGQESRELAHRWRASVDAVVVGIGTALADDPQLTARPDGAMADPAEQPRRVVFDSLARLPPASQLVAAAAEIPLTVVVSRAAARADVGFLVVDLARPRVDRADVPPDGEPRQHPRCRHADSVDARAGWLRCPRAARR